MTARRPIPGVCAHARDRMAERIGRDLTKPEWLELVEAITAGRLPLLCVQPEGGHHYLAEIGAVRVRLVWRPDWGKIATVWPADWGAAPVVRNTQRAGVVKALEIPAGFRRGKRRPRRTVWVGAR